MKSLYARITVGVRAWYLRDLLRLLEATHYSERMKAAGVPEKVRLKILRRYRPFPYALRMEMKQLVQDMKRRESWLLFGSTE